MFGEPSFTLIFDAVAYNANRVKSLAHPFLNGIKKYFFNKIKFIFNYFVEKWQCNSTKKLDKKNSTK